MSTIHYFDADGQLTSYSEYADEEGQVISTAGIKPAANQPEATKAQIVAYFSRLVDATRASYATSQAAAEVASAEAIVAAQGHRAALEAAGIPPETIDVLMPEPAAFEPAPFVVPNQAASHYEQYGLSESEVAVILQRREV